MEKLRGILFLMLVTITACGTAKNEDRILKISYSRYGGKAQIVTDLEITKDSIFYRNGRIETRKLVKEKTSKELWDRLCQVSLTEFDEIESTRSLTPVDGKDELVSITTNKKVHSFLNGKMVNSAEIRNLLAILHEVMFKMTPQPVM